MTFAYLAAAAGNKQTLNRIANNASEGTLAQLLLVNDEIVEVLNFYEGLLNGTAKRTVVKESVKKDEPKKEKTKKCHFYPRFNG
jgi:hypothetical protein